ncbi:MAG: hypothetical protein ACW96U_00855 [Candidatus Heimdallarchaeaceae archaeon]|jgi:hypothetical protein
MRNPCAEMRDPGIISCDDLWFKEEIIEHQLEEFFCYGDENSYFELWCYYRFM